MKPNAWITAHVVRPAQADGHAAARLRSRAAHGRQFGQPPLTVELDAPDKIEPGENTISLTVKDGAGRGAAADVTVMLVDETVARASRPTRRPRRGNSSPRAGSSAWRPTTLYGSMLAPEKPATPLLTAGGGAAPEYADAMASRMMKMANSLSPVQAQRFRTLCARRRARRPTRRAAAP